VNELSDWVILAAASLVAGIFNLPVAFEQLRETCRGLLFFEPVRSPGFWLWITAQLLFPSAVFFLWVTDFFSTKPTVDFMLFMKAVGAGIGFTAFLNARTETGFLTLDIKSIYNGFVRLGFDLIAAQETRRTKNFLRALETELQQPYADVVEGLRDLRAYFSIDISLSPREREKYLHSVEQGIATKEREKRIEVVESLLPEVRQQDLVDTLRRFKCSDTFLIATLPTRLSRAIALPGQ
jgi:hypothetical protein